MSLLVLDDHAEAERRGPGRAHQRLGGASHDRRQRDDPSREVAGYSHCGRAMTANLAAGPKRPGGAARKEAGLQGRQLTESKVRSADVGDGDGRPNASIRRHAGARPR